MSAFATRALSRNFNYQILSLVEAIDSTKLILAVLSNSEINEIHYEQVEANEGLVESNDIAVICIKRKFYRFSHVIPF
jgi:hypothetical protein